MSQMLLRSLSATEKTCMRPSRSITNAWHPTSEAKKVA